MTASADSHSIAKGLGCLEMPTVGGEWLVPISAEQANPVREMAHSNRVFGEALLQKQRATPEATGQRMMLLHDAVQHSQRCTHALQMADQLHRHPWFDLITKQNQTIPETHCEHGVTCQESGSEQISQQFR